MRSLITFILMGAMFIIGMLLLSWAQKRRRERKTASEHAEFVAVQHASPTYMMLVVLLPIIAGVVLITAVFSSVRGGMAKKKKEIPPAQIVPLPPVYIDDAGVDLHLAAEKVTKAATGIQTTNRDAGTKPHPTMGTIASASGPDAGIRHVVTRPDAGLTMIKEMFPPPAMNPPSMNPEAMSAPMKHPMAAPMRPSPMGRPRPIRSKPRPKVPVKVVISDNSVPIEKAVIKCGKRQVIIVRKGNILCASQNAPSVKAWRVFQEKVADQIIRQHKNVLKRNVQQVIHRVKPGPKRRPKIPPVMRQSIFPVMSAAKPKEKPFYDKYAEVFYFLFLVLGVLGKYYMDYVEQQMEGKDVEFEPRIIIISFIVAALVYYSIQQGLEKDVTKLSVRGAVFAFSNGFMFQTILRSKIFGQSPSKPKEENATAPSNGTPTP